MTTRNIIQIVALSVLFAAGSASAQAVGTNFLVNLDTAPSVPAGSENVTLADISLGATGANYNVSSIPLTISASSNASTANLTGCVLRDTSNLDGSITNTMGINNGNTTTFTLLAPMYIPAGTQQMFSLSCSVQPATAVGSSFSISINPAAVTATNANTGASVTPVGIAAGGFGPNGLPASTSGTTFVTALGTAPVPPVVVTNPTTPGVPNTGVGSESGIIAFLSLAGIIALYGAMYLTRKQA